MTMCSGAEGVWGGFEMSEALRMKLIIGLVFGVSFGSQCWFVLFFGEYLTWLRFFILHSLAYSVT